MTGELSTATITTRATPQDPHGAKRSLTSGIPGRPLLFVGFATSAPRQGERTRSRGSCRAVWLHPGSFPSSSSTPSLQKQDVCERAWAELSRTKSRLTQRQNSTIDFSKHTLPREELPPAPSPSSPPHSHTAQPQGRGWSRARRSQSRGAARAAERLRTPRAGQHYGLGAPPACGSRPGPSLSQNTPRPETAAASTLPSKTQGGRSDKRTPPKAVPPMITIRD